MTLEEKLRHVRYKIAIAQSEKERDLLRCVERGLEWAAENSLLTIDSLEAEINRAVYNK